MYTEFLIIYIGLGILFALSIANMVMLIILLRKDSGFSVPRMNNPMPMQSTQAPVTGGNVVFCKKCATQFDASQRTCPRCGTPR